MPIRLLLSRIAAERFGSRIATILEGSDPQLVHDDDAGDIGAIDAAFLTRDVTADRPFLLDLMARGVAVTTSSGANAGTVAVTAVGGVIALARRFPHFMDAQRRHSWEPISDIGGHAPPDLAGQTAVVVGLGAHATWSMRTCWRCYRGGRT